MNGWRTGSMMMATVQGSFHASFWVVVLQIVVCLMRSSHWIRGDYGGRHGEDHLPVMMAAVVIAMAGTCCWRRNR